MDTTMRNTTHGFTTRAKCYEPLNKENDHGYQREFYGPLYPVFSCPCPYKIGFRSEFSGPRSMSSNGHHHYAQVEYNLSYNNNKKERARQRQIFLQTYKLSSIDDVAKRTKASRKVKRGVNKVKSSFLSALSFGAMGSSCKCATSVSAYSPRLSVNCC